MDSAVRPLLSLLYDLASFSGRRGIIAVGLVGLGAFLEALSLATIVPLLSIAIGTDLSGSGKLGHSLEALFHALRIERAEGRLAILLAIFSLVIMFRSAVLSRRDFRVVELQAGFVEALRLRVAELLTGAKWEQIVGLRHARITQLMSGEIQRVGDMTRLLLRSTVLGAMLIAQLILVLVLAPLFAALSLSLLLVGVGTFLPFVRRAHRTGSLVSRANLTLLNSTTQFLGGLKMAMSQNLQGQFISEFKQSLHELTRQQIDYGRQQSRMRNALTILSALASGALVFVGFSVLHLAPATLIALVVIIARMMTPIGQIQEDIQQIAHLLPAYERSKLLETELGSMPRFIPNTASLQLAPDGAIVFEEVTYQHPDEADNPDPELGRGAGDTIKLVAASTTRGLQKVNITIQPGEFIGITGPSGAGKTTFVDLLVGLCEPQRGHIKVGHAALEGAALEAWRNSISYVPQDPFLFHDTVRRNITWSNPRVTEDAIWDALALVGADALIRDMAQGLDTSTGERGSLISGGERQRLALAGAILRKPRLLVLDEATSAIDVAAERRILQRLLLMPQCPTIVMIAHRSESLALCDRWFRFDNGVLIELTAAQSD